MDTTKIASLSFCYTKCCLITNTSETILIKKEDQDKLKFILNLDGTCGDIASEKLNIFAVNSTKNILLNEYCKKSNSTNPTIICSFENKTDVLDGGEDDNKPLSYTIKFQGESCLNTEDYFIDTKIQLNVVSGNYLLLNKVIICMLFILFI